jgi:metal-responsive CopG/Arc/MetJ family transcriptional regulator
MAECPKPSDLLGLSSHSVICLPVGLTAEIDAWANHQEISRSEAIRRLVELGLKLKK